MTRSFSSETDGLPNEARVALLISDIDRMVRQLDCDILAEETRMFISDPNDVAYPPLVRSLHTRRDNLRAQLRRTNRRAANLRSNRRPDHRAIR
jgi:hypothetical protein